MIAKKPADRPSSAATVARAAQALRRGDLNSAAIAVPAVIAGVVGVGAAAPGGDDAMTQLLGATQGATTIMPTTAQIPTEADQAPEKKKRSPWTWPLIALIALLIIVLGGTVWALLSNQKAPTPPPSSSASQTPPSKTPTPTPTQTRVDVDALGLVGLTCDDATAKARDAGLQATCADGDPAPAADQVGKVYNVNPTGKVPSGSSIALTRYADRTQPPKPASAPTFSGDMVAGARSPSPGDPVTSAPTARRSPATSSRSTAAPSCPAAPGSRRRRRAPRSGWRRAATSPRSSPSSAATSRVPTPTRAPLRSSPGRRLR